LNQQTPPAHPKAHDELPLIGHADAHDGRRGN
jgi:hypothetical protein